MRLNPRPSSAPIEDRHNCGRQRSGRLNLVSFNPCDDQVQRVSHYSAMRILPVTVSSATWTILILAYLLCLSTDAASRRTSSRRGGKTHGRSYSNRNTNAQTQAHSHHVQQSQPKPAAPPGSLAAEKPAAAFAPSAPKPNPPNYGWNVNGANQKPVGPPPPYPGLGHHNAAPGGMPPAYSPYHQRAPGYFQGAPGQQGGVGYPQQPHFQPSYNPYMQHQGMPAGGAAYGGMGGYGGGMYGGGMGNNFGMMGGGMGGMGMGMGSGMMMMGYPQKKSSIFSLSNVLTGVALYGMYRSLTGGFGGGYGYGGGYNSYRPQEVHIYDHREHKPSDPDDLKPILGTVGLPQSVTGENIKLPTKTVEEIRAEAPQPQNITTVVNGTEVVVEDPLPPLPFDTQPKIYFGYGFAYGYQNATVELVSSRNGEKVGGVTLEPRGFSVEPQPDKNIQSTAATEVELRASTMFTETTSTMKSQVE